LPLRQVQIRITGFTPVPGVPPPLMATDEQGRFEFTAMPSGRVTITASKGGYVQLAHGQRSPREPARLVDIGDGQVVERIDFILPRGGAMVARVTDDLGGPMAGVRVQAEEYRFVAAQGGRVLASAGSSQTDDRGEAHFSGLAPGEYYVSANAGFIGRSNPVIAVNDSDRRYGQPTYYPGVVSATEASRVPVGAGQTATIAFPMVVVRAARITGFVKTMGTPPQDFVITAMQQLASSSGGPVVTPRADGSFEWLNAMPGRYTLTVRPRAGIPVAPTGPPDLSAAVSQMEYGSVPLVVSGDDLSDVVIVTTKAFTIRGHYVFDAGTPPPNVRPDVVQLTMQGGFSAGTPVVKNDWTFELGNVAGVGTLRLRTAGTTPSGWYLKSVLLDSKDVTDIPTDFRGATEAKDLEVVLTQKRTELTGSVTDVRNAPQAGAVVVVFPEDRSLWTTQSRFIGVGRPDQQGQFRILALPPGRYLAAAVEYLETGEERDVELLTRLEPAAQRLTLGEGETKSINLKTATY
jgi:hypothetical protein